MIGVTVCQAHSYLLGHRVSPSYSVPDYNGWGQKHSGVKFLTGNQFWDLWITSPMPCTHCAPPPTALFISCVVAVFTFQALSLTAAAY